MNDKKAEFLPFHAINAFMRPDYQIEVVRSIFMNLSSLPEDSRSHLNKLIKRYVNVPGFRNSAQAPAALKVKPFIAAFEKSPEVVSYTLKIWADLHPELRQDVFDLLKSRGWDVLPVEADRSKLPGFLTVWPKGEDFEVLNQAYRDAYPDRQVSPDDVSLMIVWISDRLPYKEQEEEQ